MSDAPAPRGTAAEPDEAPVAESTLCWAFQRSFVDYVARLPDGRIAAADGAEVLDDGSFAFPAAEAAEEATGARRFAGSISFTGHHGMMAVTISAPALLPGARADSPALLTIEDPFEPGQRMALATVAPDAAAPRLTEQGADLFQGIYPQGMALEPLLLDRPTPTHTHPDTHTKDPR